MGDLIKKTDGEIISLHQVKNIKFDSIQLRDSVTIGDFLIELLGRLWEEKDEFSAKRPFGNSGWEYDIYIALADDGIIKSRIDEFGDYDFLDIELADKIILDIILLDV